MTQEVKNRIYIIILLGLLSAIGPFSIDMYLPGFELMAKDLKTDIDKVQLSLTSFFVGVAIGQIIYGPLLDRFGRRLPLLLGLLIYITTSFVLSFTDSIHNLIIYRFFQALGSCGGMVAARALVRDYFPPNETAKIFSLLMLVIAVSPIVAPTSGAYIIHFWGWQFIFIVLAIIALIILLGVLKYLPDKRGPDVSISLMPRPIVQQFLKVLKLPQFYIFALAGGFCSAGMFAYLSGSSYVMMELYGVTERQYGWIFAFLAGGLIISSQINNLVLRKFKSVEIAKTAIMIQALTGVVMILLAWTSQMSLIALLILIFIYLSCQGFVFPNASALALNPFSQLAGSASALLGSLQMTIGAFASFLTSILHDNTVRPMIMVMALCSIVAATLLLLLAKKTPIQNME